MRFTLSAIFAICLSSHGSAEPLSYNRDIRPILSDKCFHCHGPDASKRKPKEAPLRLDTFEGATKDRDGFRAVIPGKPDKSELVSRIFTDDKQDVMPPIDSHRSLTNKQKNLLKQWVKEGAKYEKHWAFVAPVKQATPNIKGSDWPKNEIDHFVLQQLTRKKLQPAAQADNSTLIRRASLTLTGLQPTPEEIDAYLADTSPEAYGKMLDRLLASPRHGEHMAYGWIEAARYADTDGYQNDGGRTMWPWRDWVIKAFNDNMPYDQFSIKQIAGDMLPGKDPQNILASAFNRNHRINNEGGALPEEFIVEYAVDRVETTSTIWLGLTSGCARCHDHKYDPLSQKEFFQLYAYFNNIPESGKASGKNAKPTIKIHSPIYRIGKGGEKQIVTVPVMQENKKPTPTYLLKRGQYNSPDKSEVLTQQIPTWLDTAEKKPTNRLDLARWLVSPQNPLAARVTVNRIWQRHFGIGLVETADNFGVQGSLPSHPELLDWLALDFMQNGWNLKRLHKQILSSATWMQQSRASLTAHQADPKNRLLSRGPRFRLGATAIRDITLHASGLLNPELGGPPVKPYQPSGLWNSMAHAPNVRYKQSQGTSLYRRDLYTYWKRAVNPPRMILFDAATRDYCSVLRNSTNTPLQALALMNDVTFVEAARKLGERMMTSRFEKAEQKLVHGFRLAAGRSPNPKETAIIKDCFKDFWNYYKSKPKEAAEYIKHGTSPAATGLKAEQHAAYMATAHLMLNMDSTIHIE